MAMNAGMGLSKIIFIAGAGYTGSILVKNGKLAEILAELQALLKDKSGGELSLDADLVSQIRRLSLDMKQLASSRPITVLNGSSSESGVTSLILPAAILGTLGYGYMWWKGISFSDLMYVTKNNMKTAVASMTKHMEDVKGALAATKKHLSQRIETLDLKVDEQKEMTKMIKNEVADARGDIKNIGLSIGLIHDNVYGLDGKLNKLEDKLDITTAGVLRLCNLVDGNDEQITGYLKSLQTQTRLAIDFEQASNFKDVTKLIMSSPSDATRGDGIVDKTPRPVTRMSIRC